MAVEAAFLGGYKVGLISACLSEKKETNGNKNKRDCSYIFHSGEGAQPRFIQIKKKKKIKDEDCLANQNVSDAVADKEDKKVQRRKISKLPKHKSSDDDPERLSRTIFVGNLPLSLARKDLKKFFKKYGEVESARLRSVAVPDLKTSKKMAAIKKTFNPNRNNMNAYVVFKEKDSVTRALASNGAVMDDFHIRVDKAGDGAKKYDHKRSVFVGNLVFDIKEEQLSEFFAPCGDVLNVRVIRDATTSIGKGFGYVLFKDSCSVSLALKKNNSELCGRKIRIQKSQKNFSDSSTSKEGRHKRFRGMKAKEKFYQKRKMLKQQKKFGLSPSKKVQSKETIKKNNLKDVEKHKKKGK